MGTTSDAYLFWGFDFYSSDEDIEGGLEIEYAEDEDGDTDYETVVGPLIAKHDFNLEQAYAEAKGYVEDKSHGFFDERGNYAHKEGSPEFLEAQQKWREERERFRTFLKGLSIETNTHGHPSGCNIRFVKPAEGFIYTASRGYPEAIPTVLPTPSDEIVAAMRADCELVGIPWPEEGPGWQLASYADF